MQICADGHNVVVMTCNIDEVRHLGLTSFHVYFKSADLKQMSWTYNLSSTSFGSFISQIQASIGKKCISDCTLIIIYSKKRDF